MITDSGYKTSDLVLPWWAGFLSGLALSLPMLQVTASLESTPLDALVGRISVSMGLGTYQEPRIALGWAVFLAIGAVLGLLYAASQVRIPSGGLLAVGLFYGFFLWVLGAVLSGVLGLPLKSMIHTWAWFAGSLTFGAGLALASILADRTRPRQSLVVPKD
ncbi:MAG: hypothetical protein HY319_13750 [Armatimonadetes bacterium]|nr:hypothetical protein [Armatimonadota bacterium]